MGGHEGSFHQGNYMAMIHWLYVLVALQALPLNPSGIQGIFYVLLVWALTFFIKKSDVWVSVLFVV